MVDGNQKFIIFASPIIHMRRDVISILLVLIILAGGAFSCCRKVSQPAVKASAEPVMSSQNSSSLWKEVKPADVAIKGNQIPLPSQFRVYQLNAVMMKQMLHSILKDTVRKDIKSTVIELPLPEGVFSRYNISETATMNPGLLEKFPQLRTYGGKGVDDPTAIAKLDFMPSGFHAYLMTQKGSVIIHPYSEGDTVNYICYYKHFTSEIKQPFELPADSIHQHN